MLMSWEPTAQRNAIFGMVVLLSRQDWRGSQYAPELRRIVRSSLDHDDRVLRYYAARGLRLIEPEPQPALAIVRHRLFAEPELDIAAVLINRLHELAVDLPGEVDQLVTDLVADPIWAARLESNDGDSVESMVPLVALLVWLAVSKDSPTAGQIAEGLFSQPVARPIARRAIYVFRDWLALPPERAAERSRAFSIIRTAARTLDALRETTEPDRSRELYEMAAAIVSQIYFASGAFGPSDDNRPTPAPDGFAGEAFSVLETLAAFKEPSIVHEVVKTLAHLAPTAPRTAFLTLEQAVRAGDPYTHDGLAADATIGLIERYLAEFREILASDPALLSAVRRVLSAFARVGWPAAVALSSRLADAFR